MRTLLVLSCLVACSTDATDNDRPADRRFDMSTWPDTVGGDRPAHVIAPTSYDGQSALPVVLMLHGYGGSGTQQDAVFQLGDRVPEQDFVLLAPDGTTDQRGSQFWNATDACCNFYQSDVDDVAYLLDLLDELGSKLPINADRVTIVGHSNGGFMAYRLACEAPERFAGIASLAGLNYKEESRCGTDGTLSVLQIHGTSDDTISYEGGTTMPSATQSVQPWAERAGCNATHVDNAVDYVSNVDGAETVITRWTGCDDGIEAELWTLEGAGHVPAVNESFRDDLTSWLLAQRR